LYEGVFIKRARCAKTAGGQFCGTPLIPQTNKQQCKCVLCIIHTEGFIDAEEDMDQDF